MPLLPPPGPLRILSLATFVNTFGNGLYFTVSVIFFTRSIGLSASQVGLGLTVAGACSGCSPGSRSATSRTGAAPARSSWG